MSIPTHYIFLQEYEGFTLHNLSTNPEQLEEFCEAFGIAVGERAIVEGSQGRVRLIHNASWGRKEVTLIEHRKELSAQVQVLAHFERGSRGEVRVGLAERRRNQERRLERQLEREARRREREKERRRKRNGN